MKTDQLTFVGEFILLIELVEELVEMNSINFLTKFACAFFFIFIREEEEEHIEKTQQQKKERDKKTTTTTARKL